jgi:hypothetical protein
VRYVPVSKEADEKNKRKGEFEQKGKIKSCKDVYNEIGVRKERNTYIDIVRGKERKERPLSGL